MLRWIGGCAVLVVLLVVIGVCAGYRKINRMAAEGPEETVVIHAPASRVFAMVANGDSLSEWRAEGLGIRTSRPGMLREGDSVIIQSTAGPSRNQRTTWHVRSVIPDLLVAFELRSDSGGMLAVRKDSVIALGDSTQIISSLVASVLDSARGARDSVGEGSAVADLASKMFLTAGRMNARAELLRLKSRIEGDSARPNP